MSAFLDQLGPIVGVLIAALTAFLTKWLTNEVKKASSWVDNSTATMKQTVALVVSTLIALVTSFTGIHLSGNSLSTLAGGDFQVILQAVVGWIGSMTIYNSPVRKVISTIESAVGLAPTQPASPVTVNIHTTAPPAVTSVQPMTINPAPGGTLADAASQLAQLVQKT